MFLHICWIAGLGGTKDEADLGYVDCVKRLLRGLSLGLSEGWRRKDVEEDEGEIELPAGGGFSGGCEEGFGADAVRLGGGPAGRHEGKN